MGDRYTITAAKNTLAERFSIDVPERYVPRFNAAPTQILPVITAGSNGISFFYWGQLPERAKNRSISSKLLYIGTESILEKPATFRALMERRCLIPADGFYDWKRISKKGRVAHRFVFEQEELVSFGGLWEEFENESGEVMHTFKILTAAADVESSTTLSSRIPFVLDKGKEKTWLSQNSSEPELKDVLTSGITSQMRSYSVSPKIDDVANDSPALIKPFAPTDQFGNYSLFD
ncbi:SOS response-associated peptidase [Fulvivirga sp. M361]|uniref:SOS response-associated peptidase n=1 Tax=Fulvivirga sp. M361 TaxID=2594266 RepID=UPI00117BA6AD|nr:SOS response-associated peptidase [Fulvivirga sp. M361]TRX52405.1 SOS response-associated peptidase [Fulvivirga sp. M361]